MKVMINTGPSSEMQTVCARESVLSPHYPQMYTLVPLCACVCEVCVCVRCVHVCVCVCVV